MTDKEIRIGKILFAKTNSIYGVHPEYRSFNRHMDRYEKFVTDMMEKYNTSRENIVRQIHYLKG